MSTEGQGERRMAKPENVLFLHIPKTAGTSLKHHLFHRYAAQQCLLDPSPRAIEEADFDDYALVAGHLDFDFVRRFRRPPLVLTCLRNPIDRALSAYHYSRTPRLKVEVQSTVAQIGDRAVAEILDELRRLNDCDSLAEFLRREPELAQKNLGNVQTRFLAGAAAAVSCAHEPQRLLALARKNLQACSAILFTERMSEATAALELVLGQDEFGEITHDNATPVRTKAAEQDPALIAALARLCDLDLQLYGFAEELCRERLTARLPVTPARARNDLPDAADFTFDQPVRGRGWHIREQGVEGWYCWTGQEAKLHLALNTTGSHVLRFWIDHAASEQALHGLEVWLNGIRLSALPVKTGRQWVVEASVPAEAIRPPLICIKFRVPHTVRPSQLDALNPDTRQLGIALSRLQLRPLSGHHPAGARFPS